MKKVLKLIILTLFLNFLAGCGESLSTSPLQQQSNNSRTYIQQADYQYSLETDKRVIWSQNTGFLPMSQCETNLYSEMLSLLNESVITQGPLSTDTYHTADNPLHRLTLTYQNGSTQTFNLDVSRAYVTEDVLSNSPDIIDFFESIFFGTACN